MRVTHVNDRQTDELSLRKKLQSSQKQVREMSLVRKGTLGRHASEWLALAYCTHLETSPW